MTTYQNLVGYMKAYGVMDFLLPFILVFTIVFAVLQKTKILGDKKNFNVIVSFVLGLLFVVPHMTGQYPAGYDPVAIMNSALPSISLVAVASIMLLLLMGIFGTNFSKKATPFIAILAIIFVGYIFGATLNFWQGPYDVFSWWTSEVTELLIIILVFGLIVYFIIKEPSKGESAKAAKDILGAIGDFFEKK